MPVGEMLRRMSSIELGYWKAYMSREPFGECRADWRAAQIARAVMGSVAPGAVNDTTVADFVLEWKLDEPEPQTVEDQIAVARVAADALKG